MRGVSLKESVLYRIDSNPVYYLDHEQQRYLSELFARMSQNFATDYAHKDDLHNQLSLVVHEATRLRSASPCPSVATNVAERVTNLFLTLLEIEFPVRSTLTTSSCSNTRRSTPTSWLCTLTA
jgi:AraC family transcriptional activator of pobA